MPPFWSQSVRFLPDMAVASRSLGAKTSIDVRRLPENWTKFPQVLDNTQHLQRPSHIVVTQWEPAFTSF